MRLASQFGIDASYLRRIKPYKGAAPRGRPGQTRMNRLKYKPSEPPVAPERGVKPMMSNSRMYVCRRCQANFKTGDGKPDARLPGLGKCNKCLAAATAAIAA